MNCANKQGGLYSGPSSGKLRLS
jgi:hypothetical protein